MEGAYAEARSVVEEAWRRRTAPSHVGTHRLAVARAILARQAHMPDEILETVADQERRNGAHPELAFLRGCALEDKSAAEPPGSLARTARLQEAEAAYRASLAHYPNRLFDSLRGARSWLGQTRLGTVLLLLGRPPEAGHAFEAALRAQPGYWEAELGLAEVDLAERRPLAGLHRLEPILGKIRDAWWLASRAAADLGSAADARLFLSRALSDRGAVKAWHRAEAMAALAAADPSLVEGVQPGCPGAGRPS
jgi:tetratricopeptide (TPR) repeat protein